MILILAAILVAVGVVSLFVLAWWGLPFLAIAAVLALLHVTASRKSAGPDAGTIERGRRTEPTGTPRKATAGAETANERVGQA
jgi:membrane protein implicated in regulation of membrane protease activity